MNKTHKLRVQKEKIETVILDRVRQYLDSSDTLRQVINLSLKHRAIGVPVVEDRIKQILARLIDLQKAVTGFSESLRRAAIESPDKLDQICAFILEEKKKAESESAQLQTELDELTSRKTKLTAEHRERSLQDYLELAMRQFSVKPGQQQKQVIQAIVPRVIFHPDKRLELRINPDPSGCHNLEENFRLRDKWRGGRDSNPRPPA